MFCPWAPAKYLIFSENVNVFTLFFYSHVPVMILSLILGIFVLIRNRNKLEAKLMFAVTVLFFFWSFFDLAVTSTNDPSVVMFFWSLQVIIEVLVYLLSVHLYYSFVYKKDLSLVRKIFLFLPVVPVLVFIPTKYGLIGVDIEDCNAVEGFISKYYTYAVEIFYIFTLIVAYLLVIKKKHTKERLKEIKLFTLGIILFLVAFSSGNIIGSFTDNWDLAQVGLIGMPIFIAYIVYIMVQFKSFNIKVLSTQVLVWVLAALIGAQFFFIKVPVNFVLNGFTFVAALFFGQLLILSVKREVNQSEELRIDTETLYSKNVEIATVNKTLSLLRKLYQISLLTIDPDSLSKKISDEVRVDLNLEFVGILGFDEVNDTLLPFNFSKSERLANAMKEQGFLFKDFKISDIKNKPFLKEPVYAKVSAVTEKLEDIWGGTIDSDKLKVISEVSHVKTALIYPLTAETKLIGLLLIGLNRNYNTLSENEKDSIKSCIDVIAVALDKAYLYKELQDANANLKQLITQRESLVHLITHKVKGSFTRSKYLFSEMLDGSFGPLSDILTSMVKRGFDSDVEGIATVDLVLNSANLQNGTVKYDMKPTDFKDLVSKLFTEKKVSAEAKGLKMDIDTQEEEYTVSGDAFWLKEVIVNLFENSIRYTKEGSIKVGLKKNGTKILFSVIDTGVGITDEDKKHLFTEGGRGKDSVKMNVDSTGYGLFSVKLIVEAHKGRIWAESEGQDKGSAFYVELEAIK